jgi:hypothetical protein
MVASIAMAFVPRRPEVSRAKRRLRCPASPTRIGAAHRAPKPTPAWCRRGVRRVRPSDLTGTCTASARPPIRQCNSTPVRRSGRELARTGRGAAPGRRGMCRCVGSGLARLCVRATGWSSCTSPARSAASSLLSRSGTSRRSGVRGRTRAGLPGVRVQVEAATAVYGDSKQPRSPRGATRHPRPRRGCLVGVDSQDDLAGSRSWLPLLGIGVWVAPCRPFWLS